LNRRTAVVFKRLDLKGDGVIDRGVFERSLRQYDPEAWDDRRLVRRLLRAIDTNGDGLVQQEELRAWLAREGDPWDEARESAIFVADEEGAGAAAEEAEAVDSQEAGASEVPAVNGDESRVFKRLDLKGDGVIDLDEFMNALVRLDEDSWDDSHRVRRLFKAIDADRDGLLQPEEFNSWLRSSGDQWDEARESAAFAENPPESAERQAGQVANEEQDDAVLAMTIFQRLDSNCDGVVDKEEFARALLEFDEDNWNARTIRRLFKAIDRSNKGCLQLQEIAEWLGASGDQWDEVRTSPAFSLMRHSASVRNIYQQASISDFYGVDGEKLGEGSFGSVAKCRHRVTHMLRAAKTILKRKMDREELETEIEIMARLDHPHILRIYEVFEDEATIHIVTELCLGGELFNRIVEAEGFTERQGAAVMKQITGGVRYMHENGVCHRDLKPENFLLRDRGPIEQCIVKIIDFGLACEFKPGEPMTERQGTLFYIAPQVITGSYDHACDIWSCGVIMYILLSGYPPFGGNSDEDILACVRSGTFQFHKEYWSTISTDAKDLIRWQLQYEPRHRCTAQQATEHVWIRHQAPAAVDLPLQAGQLKNMRAFCTQNRLKKAALQIIAKELQEEQIQQLQEMFVSLDRNGDGKVTFQELEEGIARMEKPDIAANIREVAHEVDVNRSGSIDYSEFLAAALDRRQYEEEKVCWSAFHAFDRDGDGSINREELHMVLEVGNIEAVMGGECMSRILAEHDENNDGLISFQEFMQMMRGHA